jgi:hypothetical protein
MEHLGAMAAEAESEEEAAEQFLPLIGMAASKLLPVVARAVAPLAKRALPKIARAVSRVSPQLTRSVGRIARGLFRQPSTRPLLRAMPTIARRTMHSIARQAARNRPVTSRTAVRTLTTQARRVLGNPRQRVNVMRRHRRMDRRFHRQAGRGMVRPHSWRYGRVGYGPGQVPGAAVGSAVPPMLSRRGVRYGQMIGGQCSCQVCPTCGVGAMPQAAVPVRAAVPAPAPAYCGCCGQVLR